MKVWQLISITNNNIKLIAQVALKNPVWEKYEALFINFSNFVKTQDRATLDSALDTDFIVAVLKEIQQSLYYSSDHWLRSWKLNPDDQNISFLNAFEKYGAEILETACERGAVRVL